MLQKIENSKRLDFLLAIIFLQALVYISVIFDVAVVRQGIGFLYLSFVPGYLIVKLLKFRFGTLETLTFSVGFSVAFLMLVGLFLNELGFMAGILQPLSTVPLLVALNMFVLILAVLAYLRSEPPVLFDKVSLSSVKWALPLTLPLVLSVVGAILVNVYNDNRVLLVMILAVSLITAVLMLKNKFSSKIYAFVIFIIGISLLYHSSLISKYLTSFGSDVTFEHFVFKNVQENGYWSPIPLSYWDVGLGRLNSMLSITVLPTIYSNLIGLDSTWIFKLVFPLIFAIVPLSLYQLWKDSYGEKFAFVSVFFFMATATFYTELLGLNRQMIAELFFILLLFVLLDKRMSRFHRFFSFTIFGFGLVVSHYGLAEVFLFFIVSALICVLVYKRRSDNLTIGMVVLFFSIMFTWYIYTSRASVFQSFLDFADYVRNQLSDFFNLESRGETVLRGLGLEPPPTIWNTISRVFAYITEFLIIVGFISFIFERKKFNVGSEHFLLTSEAMGFLAALIVVPGLANTMNMTRFYHVLLFFLAPLCILGSSFLIKLLFKHRKGLATSVLLTFVLIPYFLFQSNFIYEITKCESWSLPLSMYRMNAYRMDGLGYIPELDVVSAYWLSCNIASNDTRIYADIKSINRQLTAYGLMQPNMMLILFNTTKPGQNEFVYLRKLNAEDGLVNSGSIIWNSSDILSTLENISMIYSNGVSEIYKK